MKKQMIRVLGVMLLLMACGSISVLADGVPSPPYCPPGAICN